MPVGIFCTFRNVRKIPLNALINIVNDLLHRNSDIGFAVDTENDVEVGLSAVTRHIVAITASGNTHDVSTGDTVVAGKTGSLHERPEMIMTAVRDLVVQNAPEPRAK